MCKPFSLEYIHRISYHRTCCIICTSLLPLQLTFFLFFDKLLFILENIQLQYWFS